MVLNPKGQRINREEEELEPDDFFFWINRVRQNLQ